MSKGASISPFLIQSFPAHRQKFSAANKKAHLPVRRRALLTLPLFGGAYLAARDTITHFAAASATSELIGKRVGSAFAWAGSIAARVARVKRGGRGYSGYSSGSRIENPSHMISVSGMPARMKSAKR